jgi:hypothetical protein
MVPRAVLAAQAVAATLTPTELSNYGNILFNGVVDSVPNTAGKLAFQYKETLTAPIVLPSLTQATPALKGWTNNAPDYFTQLPINAYGQVPGIPTQFEYTVRSFDGFYTMVSPTQKVYTPTGDPRWGQRHNRQSVATGSFLYPVADRTAAPPIDIV